MRQAHTLLLELEALRNRHIHIHTIRAFTTYLSNREDGLYIVSDTRLEGRPECGTPISSHLAVPVRLEGLSSKIALHQCTLLDASLMVHA